MASSRIYQFYSELNDFEPKIWRRFQVPENITMARLGFIVMTMYEMMGNHLMNITVPATYPAHLRSAADPKYISLDFTQMDDYEDFSDPSTRVEEITTAKMRHYAGDIGQEVTVNYDFGDGWEVLLKLETIFEDKELPGKELPRVIDGAGWGIVEDCGGTGGLEDLVKAFKRKKGPEYRSLREWLGKDDFDISAFDIDDINFRLKKLPRVYTDLYEYGIPPTDRSIAIIERRYK